MSQESQVKPPDDKRIEEENKINDKYEEIQSEYQSIMKCNSPDDVQDVIERVNIFRNNVVTLGGMVGEYERTYGGVQVPGGQSPLDDFISKHRAVYESLRDLDLHTSKLAFLSNEKAVKRSREGLVNQLSIFSIVLTILTFILNNARLFSIGGISFSMIMAGNVSFILMCVVMFTFVYLFLHMEDGIKHPIIKAVVLVVVILGLCFLTYALTTVPDNRGTLPSTSTQTTRSPVPVGTGLPLPTPTSTP